MAKGKSGATDKGDGAARKLVASNKKARHDYHIEDTYEAGMVLQGTEVKSLRDGPRLPGRRLRRHRPRRGLDARRSTSRSTPSGTWTNHAARRKRKLLLHRDEIDKIERKVSEKGHTVVPLALYFVKGRAKIEIGLAKGKKSWDKRQAIAERTADREKEEVDRSPAQGHA